MAELTTAGAAIDRLKQNEDRFDTFINTDNDYVTNEAVPRSIESLPAFIQRMINQYLTLDIKEAWQTTTAYEVQDLVTESGIVYICLEDHTSGTFATDLAANKWTIYQGLTALTGISLVADYTDLRNYASPADEQWVLVTDLGIAGLFKYDASETAADNGGTIIENGSGAFLRSYDGPINVEWFGAAGDGSTDDSGAVQSAVDAGTDILLPADKTWKIEKQIDVTQDGTVIRVVGTVDASSISDISNATSGVNNTVDVVAAFKVTGDRVRIINDGIFLGSVNASTANVCAILLYGVSNPVVEGSGKFQDFYNSVWPVKGCTAVKLRDFEVSNCSHNLKIGSDELVAASPEVTGIDIDNLYCHGSTNDGMKLASFVFNAKVSGGQYNNNTRDGIDTYVGGEECSFENVTCQGNTIKGMDCKLGSLSGTSAGKGGFNRRCKITNCNFLDNGIDGLSVEGESGLDANRPYGFTIAGNLAKGNAEHGFDLNIRNSSIRDNEATENTQRGFNILSCADVTFEGNRSIDNCQGGSVTEGYNIALAASGTKNTRLTFNGNQAYGGTYQTRGFSMAISTIENSRFIGNISDNHSIKDWNIGTGFTSDDVLFKDNIGLILEREFTVSINSGNAVAHGLSVDADYVWVMPMETGVTDVVTSSIAGSDFIVNYGGTGPKTFAVRVVSKMANLS